MELNKDICVTKSQSFFFFFFYQLKGLLCSSNLASCRARLKKTEPEAQGELSSWWAAQQGLITGKACWCKLEFKFIRYR